MLFHFLQKQTSTQSSSHQDQKTQWTHPTTGKSKKVYGELPFGWEKEVHNSHLLSYLEQKIVFFFRLKKVPVK